MQRLVDAFIKSTLSNNGKAGTQLVDNRWWIETIRLYDTVAFERFGLEELEDYLSVTLTEDPSLLMGFTSDEYRTHIHGKAHQAKDGTWGLVYTRFELSDYKDYWLCFYCSRAGSELKVFDIGSVEEGWRISRRIAADFHRDDEVGEARTEAWQQLRNASDLLEQDQTVDAKEILDAINLKLQTDTLRFARLYHLFIIAMRLEEYDQADILLTELEAVLPEAEIALESRLSFAMKTGDFEQALLFNNELQSRMGGSPNLLWLEGKTYHQLGQDRAAFGALDKALDLDPTHQLAFEELLELSISAEERGISKRFERLADPSEWFRATALKLYHRDEFDELLRLVAVYRNIDPGDSWSDWYEARANYGLKRFEQAKKLYLSAAKELDDEQMRKEAFSGFTLASEKLGGSTLDAYSEAIDDGGLDPSFFFHLLANHIEYREDLSELNELVELHRRAKPDDPWVYYYSGWVALHDQEGGDLAAAEIYSQGYRKTEDAELKDILRSRAVGHYCAGGKARYAYQEFGSCEATFRELVLQLAREGNEKDLDWLKEEHRWKHPQSSINDWAEVRSAWDERRYDDVTKLMDLRGKMLGNENFDEEWPDGKWSVQNWWFRSLVRTQQLDLAWELAGDIEPPSGEDKHNLYHIVVLAARGQSDRVLRFLEKMIEDGQTTPFWIYNDEDLRALLQQEAYDEFRLKYPIGRAIDETIPAGFPGVRQQLKDELLEDSVPAKE